MAHLHILLDREIHLPQVIHHPRSENVGNPLIENRVAHCHPFGCVQVLQILSEVPPPQHRVAAQVPQAPEVHLVPQFEALRFRLKVVPIGRLALAGFHPAPCQGDARHLLHKLRQGSLILLDVLLSPLALARHGGLRQLLQPGRVPALALLRPRVHGGAQLRELGAQGAGHHRREGQRGSLAKSAGPG